MGHVSATKSVVTVQGSHKHFVFLGSVMSDHVLSTNPIPPILSTILDPWSLKWLKDFFRLGSPLLVESIGNICFCFGGLLKHIQDIRGWNYTSAAFWPYITIWMLHMLQSGRVVAKTKSDRISVAGALSPRSEPREGTAGISPLRCKSGCCVIYPLVN